MPFGPASFVPAQLLAQQQYYGTTLQCASLQGTSVQTLPNILQAFYPPVPQPQQNNKKLLLLLKKPQ